MGGPRRCALTNTECNVHIPTRISRNSCSLASFFPSPRNNRLDRLPCVSFSKLTIKET